MGTLKPPKGFTTLAAAYNTPGPQFDTIGVCVDYLEPTRIPRKDCTVKFVLHDPSWFNGKGLNVRFFQSSLDKLPAIKANGDVVILRNLALKSWNQQLFGLSNSNTSWVVLSGSDITESKCADGSDIRFTTSSIGLTRAPAPSTEELVYAKEIVRLEDPNNYRPPPKSTALEIESRTIEAGGTPQPRKDKWRAIKDLSLSPDVGKHNFADIFGEVRKTWDNGYGRMDISLTDYTTNKRLHNYANKSEPRDGDEYGHIPTSHESWPGPWGRMTLSVALFDAHASFARSEVKAGMYVLIKNCHIKLDTMNTKLEAVCRGDREDVTKVNVVIYKPRQAEGDERFQALLKRRLEYERFAKSQGLRFSLSNGPESKKRTIENLIHNNTDQDKPTEPTKNDTKSSKKKRKRAEKQNQDTATISNNHVRCKNINVPTKPVSDILDPTILHRTTPKGNAYTLPFQNCSYKCNVRVVDYYPHNLEDFSIPYRVSDYDTLSDFDSTEDTELALTAAETNPDTVRWEWRFFLIVEDAKTTNQQPGQPKPQMALLVADTDADYLLNKEATDLRDNHKDLMALEHTLFILWGNLKEKKEETAYAGGNMLGCKVSSKPFECFIKEYGIPVSEDHANGDENREASCTNYQRMFRMFGTSI